MININKGIVIRQESVASNTTFAQSSCSVWWSSARDNIIAPLGAADKTRIQALNVESRPGMKYTARYASSGKTINLNAHVRYANGSKNNVFKFIAESLSPKTIIHIGVVIEPSNEIVEAISLGKWILKIYKGNAIIIAILVGFNIAALIDIYFLFKVIKNTPKVNAIKFILIT